MTAEEIRIATLHIKHIGMLSELVLCGWPLMKLIQSSNHRWHGNERQKNKDTCSTARERTKASVPKPHGHREDKLLACESIYLINMNVDMGKQSKLAPLALTSRQHD